MTWKQIPNFPDYAISNTGVVKNVKTGTIRKLHPNSEGYLMLTASRGGKKYTLYPHRLVCRLFNGEKTSDDQIVNHKDGVKTNNHHSNLEWTTYSGNSKHAFMMGLSPVAMQISVTDTENGNVLLCNSMREVESVLGVRWYDVVKLLRKGNDELFQGRYLFELLREPIRVDSRLGKIIIHDMKDNTHDVANSLNIASIKTGVGYYYIKVALKKGTLVNGIHFRYDDGRTLLTNFTSDDIEQSIREYNADKRWFVKNYITDEIQIFDTVTEIAEYFKVIPDVIYSHLKRDTAVLFNAHHIQQGTDEFPDHSVDRIVVSQLWGNMPTRPIKVTDRTTGDECYHKSIFALGRDLGISNTQIDRLAKKNTVPNYDICFI